MVQAEDPERPDERSSAPPQESTALARERDLDQPYARVAERRTQKGTLAGREETDTLVGRIPGYDRRTATSVRELEAQLRADPAADPQAISWLDQMDEKRALVEHLRVVHNRVFPYTAPPLDELRAVHRVLSEAEA